MVTFTLIAALSLSLFSLSMARTSPIRARQSTNTISTTLYAYGTNISGATIFYGDGFAYIGSSTPSGVSIASNITFNASSDTTTPWTVTANNTSTGSTNTTLTGTNTLYIITTAGSYSQVGFSNGTLPDGAVTSGFTFFGKNVAYAASESDYEMQFWAQKTDTEDIWALMWNEDGTAESDSVPVTIKTTPPSN